jgi:flagellin-like protein
MQAVFSNEVFSSEERQSSGLALENHRVSIEIFKYAPLVRKDMRPLDRRGLSPLIATVLLMAFAVALGGMIMNWSNDFGAKASSSCAKVKLDVTKFCHDDNVIFLGLRNSGEQPVAALLLNITDPALGRYLLSLEASNLTPESTFNGRVPFVVGNQTIVSIVARVGKPGGEQACGAPLMPPIIPLPKC